MRIAAHAGRRRWLAAALCAVLHGGCAGPEVPEVEAPELPPPLENCATLTILVDASRRGDPQIAARTRRAMSSELERFGARISDSPAGAYWSLMILASPNSRRDGFIVSVLLSARTASEGIGPGMTTFAREQRAEPEAAAGAGDGDAAAADAAPVPTLYSGLAYGSWGQLESQARALARQAYTTVYPALRRLCDYEASERLRERALEEQLPAPPRPL